MLTYSTAVKRLILRTFIIAVFGCITLNVSASGIGASSISYAWVSDSTYQIIYSYYVDCSSGTAVPDSISICISNTCGFVDSTVYIHKETLIPPKEVNYTCYGHATTCGTGSLPGYKAYQYLGNVKLPGRCDHWVFSHALAGRDPYVKNIHIVGIDAAYVEATLNNVDGQGNSSPYFITAIPFVFWDSVFATKSIEAFDPNGDSLSYEMLVPRTGTDCSPSDELYNLGYSFPDKPVFDNSTFSFDPDAASMQFTPSGAGKFVMAYRVNDYKKKTISGVSSWVKVGSCMKDEQIIVLTAPVPVPRFWIDSTSIVGATMRGGVINVCAGSPFTVCYRAKTIDTMIYLLVRPAFIDDLPSKIHLNHITSDSSADCLPFMFPKWDTGNYILNFYVTDITCDNGFPETSNFYFPVHLNPSAAILTYGGYLCSGDTSFLFARGDSANNYIWDVLPGGAPFSSLSCNYCVNPFATPNITTTYTVYAPDNNSCGNKDTITILVKPRPATPIVGSNSPICSGDTLRLSLTDTATVIARRWIGPGGYRSAIKNPKIFPASSGVYKAYDSSNGCASYPDSITVVVKPKPGKPIVSSNSPICARETLRLHAMDTTAGVSYYWRTPDTSLLYIVPSPVIPFAQAGIYKSYATLNGCTSDTARLIVTVDSAGPPIVSVFSFPDTVIPSFYMIFKTIVSNVGSKPRYQWQKNGVDIKGATNNVLITNDIKVHDIISVIVYSDLPCAIPDSTVASTWPLNVNDINSGMYEVAVYPNPNKGNFTIKGRIKNNTQNVSVSVINLLGQTIFTAQLPVSNGIFQQDISLPGMAKGVYTLQVQANGASYSTKITVMK